MTLIFQVTYNCNLHCDYCYQPKTQNRTMTLEEARIFLDEFFQYWFTGKSKIFETYVTWPMDEWKNHESVLRFFGGEATLYADLIINIIEYFKSRCLENNLEDLWNRTEIWIDTNGTLIQTEKVQQILFNYKDKLIWNVTFEATKEMHDRKRKDLNGQGSFDIVSNNINYLMEEYSDEYSFDDKLTFDEDTMTLLPSVIKALVKKGYRRTKFSWDTTKLMTAEQSEQWYQLLCEVTDWIIDNNIRFYLPYWGYTFSNTELVPSCGSDGGQICISPGGKLSSCFMSTDSFTEGVEDLTYGDVYNGITNVGILERFRNRPTHIKMSPSCANCPIIHACELCPMSGWKAYGDLNKSFRPCGETLALVRAQLYFLKKVEEKGDYPYYQRSIEHIKATNNYDPNYHYWVDSNYRDDDFVVVDRLNQ